MAVICWPGCSQLAWMSGDADGVVVTIISAPCTACLAVSATVIGMFKSALRLLAQAAAFAASRAQILACLISRTKHRAFSCSLACVPAPMMQAVSEFWRAKQFAATAPAAAVRISVRYPLSKSSASSMPVFALNTTIRPEVLGRPKAGLSKNPGDILIAKDGMPGT